MSSRSYLILCFAAFYLTIKVSADDSLLSRREFQQLVTRVKELEEFAAEQVRLNRELSEKLAYQEFSAPNVERTEERSSVFRNRPDSRSLLSAIIQRLGGDNTIAFSAVMSMEHQDHIGAAQNLIFDDIRTNLGGGYSSSNGVFTTPTSGLYLITTAILSRQDMEFWVDIKVNGNIAARLNERGTDGRHGSASHTIIIALNKGDVVAVVNNHADTSFWGNKYSSFSGFLIAEFEGGIIVE